MLFDPTGVNWVMNVLQAASYLGVSSNTIDDMVSSKMIPFTRVGDRIVFSKMALDQWVYAKSMENLTEDLPSLGFLGGKGR